MNEHSPHASGRQEYDIRDFGARVCDSLQTEAIQNAIDACFLGGGGKVIVPCGIFLTGGIRLRSGVTLYLRSGAVLKASRDPADYDRWRSDSLEAPVKGADPSAHHTTNPRSHWNNAIIRAIDAHDIAIIGETGSYIDGGNCYDPQGEEGYRGPHGIGMHRCKNIHLEGYTVVDSGNWAHAIFSSQNITARNLTVYGGHDAFDVRSCDQILIEGCELRSGDDCVAGFDNHDCVVRNCILDSACSSFRFGGNNVLIENCESFAPASFGFRGSLSADEKRAGAPTVARHRHSMSSFFRYFCDFRANIRKDPGNITIRNCSIHNSDGLFRLDFDGKHQWCCNRSLNSIHFENCRVSGISRPIHIHSDPQEPLHFSMKNVTITPKPGFEGIAVMDTIHHAQIRLEEVDLEGYSAPTVLAYSDGAIHTEKGSPLLIHRLEPEV